MKKIKLQLMAVLMVAVMLMPFVGNAATAYAEETHKGAVTITASGDWVEKEVSINELLGNVAPEDVKAIKFTSNVAFYAGYNTVDHSWEWSTPAKSYTAKNIALDGWYAFKFAINVNDGKNYTINWEVLTTEEGESQESEETPATGLNPADYVGDYALGYKFASSDFANINGEARISFDFVRTGEHEQYQYTMIKYVEGWPKLGNADYAELETPVNDWGFIELTDDSVNSVSFVLSEKLVKELAGGVDLGVQVYGIVVGNAKITAIPKATPTPTPSPTPTPTPVPKEEVSREVIGGELVITDDMVSKGMVVIQNAEYDSVVLKKDVEVEYVYFKNVAVGNVEIEGCADYKVIIQQSDINELNVNSPEIEGISLKQLLQLTDDNQEITPEIWADYAKYNETVAKIKDKTVTVVVKGYSTVETVNVAANVKVDFSGIIVEQKSAEEELELFADTDALTNMNVYSGLGNEHNMKVQVNGYHGNVYAKLPAEQNAYTYVFLTFKNSQIEQLICEGTDGSFYISGSDSVVDTVAVNNIKAVTVGLPAESIAVSETTKGADISVYDKVDAVIADGTYNDIVLAMAAYVKNAEVIGDNIRIYGYGHLGAANITGAGANIAVRGANVVGENDTNIPEEMRAMSPVRVGGTSGSYVSIQDGEGDNTSSSSVHTFKRDDADPTYKFLITDYISDYAAGDEVKITVKLSSTSWFGGGLGGNHGYPIENKEWKQVQFQNADDLTAEAQLNIVESYGGAGEIQVQIWWWGDEAQASTQEIVIESISIEKVAAVETPEEPEPAYVGSAVYNDESDWWGQYNVDAATILGGVAAEDVAYVEFSCDVNLVIQYNQVGNDGGAIQTTPATYHKLSDINFSGFYMDIILNGGTGEDKTVTWKVYTK